MNSNEILRFIVPKKSKDVAYAMGIDCSINGANEHNCHFSIFSSPENTKKWEEGKKYGDDAKHRD